MQTFKGLTQEEALSKLKELGPNEIQEVSKSSPFKILLRQVQHNFVFYLLFAAALISFIVNNSATGYAIVGVIIMVLVTGFVQEYKAEKAISALKNMILPLSIAIRDRIEVEIASTHIVVGDILILRSGERIPADCVLLDGEDIEVNESILTGESNDVHKIQAANSEKHAEENMLYMGSFMVRGKCIVQVIHTGMNTKFGKIARLISTVEKDLPLQRKVNEISKIMVIVAIISSVSIGFIMLSRADLTVPYLIEILILVIAISVSAFPEGFPVVLTTTLAAGSSRMAKQNAIVNRMSIIETLGETTVICTDKTGTLTMGEMTVREIRAGDEVFRVTGTGYSGEGVIQGNDTHMNIASNTLLQLLLKAGVVCNDAKIEKLKTDHDYEVKGNQTEGALLILGVKAKVFSEDFLYERTIENPFSSERKMMSVVTKEPDGSYMYAKGAFEIMIEKCSHIYENNMPVELSPERKKKLSDMNHELTSQALRTLVLAYKKVPEHEDVEENLVMLGTVALEDPPRREAQEAIATCKRALITVKMITGDNSQTAIAIGKQVGIEGNVLLGKEISDMTDAELKSVVKDTAIFARVNPEHKLRIVKALKDLGEIVTMTGDGVNDAPALKEAHIGVAMGKNGTDVSRSVADLTLKDDNFATIVSAIKEGRTIFDNIRKFVTYQLSTNVAELTVLLIGVMLSPVLGWEAPILLSLQILFINLVTDNMPAITLGLNPTSKDIMNNPPRRKSRILGRVHVGLILGLGGIMAVSALSVYYVVYNLLGETIVVARTAALVTLVTLEIVNAFTFRSFRKPVLSRSLFVNKYLLIATFLSLTATAIILYTPIRDVFSTAPLDIRILKYPMLVGLLLLLIQDTVKLLPAQWAKAFINSLQR